MNPSAAGWIAKFGQLVKDEQHVFKNMDELYVGLKKTGFTYGINVKTPRFINTNHALSEDEKAKINLFTGLYYTYSIMEGEQEFASFLDRIFQFYDDLKLNQISLLNKILTGKKTSSQLEKLINSRVYLADNAISKAFNSIITNSLLFIDVLTFKKYLEGDHHIERYARELERMVINLAYHTLNSKEKNKTDEKLAQLFAASITFIDPERQNFDGSYRNQLIGNFATLENRYFLDVVCLTIWEDNTLEFKESEFIFGIGKDLGFQSRQIKRALEEISYFFLKNANDIPYLKDNNLALQFYEGMAKVVNKLILRNSKRLQNELSESKELVALISKATIKDLTPEEKKKVQNQLIDIFKSIPSLAIFILPGGAVLLPIFIKLVPKLLPSSFDENRLE